MTVEIPAEKVNEALLSALIEEFVTREGTDYGFVEYSLEDKIASVRDQLARGEAVIVFDEETESVDIVLKRK
jgi:uncharacterized protein